MMPTTVTRKSMTIGEGGTALAFAALAVSSIFVAAGAHTPEYAFHAWLSAAASIATVFAIVNRYYERPAQLPPATIEDKPNYNMGPVKFATVAPVTKPCATPRGLNSACVNSWSKAASRASPPPSKTCTA